MGPYKILPYISGLSVQFTPEGLQATDAFAPAADDPKVAVSEELTGQLGTALADLAEVEWAYLDSLKEARPPQTSPAFRRLFRQDIWRKEFREVSKSAEIYDQLNMIHLNRLATVMAVMTAAHANGLDAQEFSADLFQQGMISPDEIWTDLRSLGAPMPPEIRPETVEDWLVHTVAPTVARGLRRQLDEFMEVAVPWDFEVDNRMTVTQERVTAEKERRYREAEAYLQEKHHLIAPSRYDAIRWIEKAETLPALSQALQAMGRLDLHGPLFAENVAAMASALWLAGRPGDHSDTGVVRWLKQEVDTPLAFGVGKVAPGARNLAEVLFPESELQIPHRPEKVFEFVQRHRQHMDAVIDHSKVDMWSNDMAEFQVEIFATMVGMRAAGAAMGAARNLAYVFFLRYFKKLVWELPLSARIGLGAAEIAAVEVPAFNLASDIVTLPITGLPSPKDVVDNWISGIKVFGGLRVVGMANEWLFGFRSMGARLDRMAQRIEERVLRIPGRALRPEQAEISYRGSAAGMSAAATHFGGAVALLSEEAILSAPDVDGILGQEAAQRDRLSIYAESALNLGIIIFMGRGLDVGPSLGEGLRLRTLEKINAADIRGTVSGMGHLLNGFGDHYEAFGEIAPVYRLSRFEGAFGRLAEMLQHHVEIVKGLPVRGLDVKTAKAIARVAEDRLPPKHAAALKERTEFELGALVSEKLAPALESMREIFDVFAKNVTEEGMIRPLTGELGVLRNLADLHNTVYGRVNPLREPGPGEFCFESPDGGLFMANLLYSPYPLGRPGAAPEDAILLLGNRPSETSDICAIPTVPLGTAANEDGFEIQSIKDL